MEVIEGGPEHVDAAALIWAHAVTVRDSYDEVPSLAEARPGIERALEGEPTMFLIALDGERPVGFATGRPQSTDTAFVNFVGVHPDAWGKGVARALLEELPGALARRGYARVELMVWVDNERAVRLYESFGWRKVGEPVTDVQRDRVEQRYALRLAG